MPKPIQNREINYKSTMDSFLNTIKEKIRGKIRDKTFIHDRPLPSCRNLALMFDASPSTISTALRELEADQIISRHPGKKFFPIPGKKNVITPKISTIIALGTDFFGDNDLYYASFIDVLEEETARRNLSFKFVKLKGLNLRSRQNQNIRTRLFDPTVGVVMLAPVYPHDIAFFSRAKIPFVVLNNHYTTESPCIIGDPKKLPKALIDLAASNHHRNLGLISIGRHKMGEIEQPLLGDLATEGQRKNIQISESDILVVDKINNQTDILIENFFDQPHRATLYLVAGDDLALKVKRIIDERPELKDLEFVNHADRDTGIFPLNITKATALQVKLAMGFLLGEEVPEKKIIYIDLEMTESEPLN